MTFEWHQVVTIALVAAVWGRMEATQKGQRDAIDAIRLKVDAALGNGHPGNVVTRTECSLVAHANDNAIQAIKDRLAVLERNAE